MRWREADLEQAILDDLAGLRMPSEEIAEWFRVSVKAAFADVDELQRHRRQSLAKRKTDLANMKDRLLNGFLSGAIEEPVFRTKSQDLNRESAEVEEALEQAKTYDSEAPVRALALFDFSQNLVDLWRGSNSEEKRDILECVSLNRTVDSVSLCVVKRKPFDFLAERPFLRNGRGGGTRTHGLMVPNHARYQTAPHPVRFHPQRAISITEKGKRLKEKGKKARCLFPASSSPLAFCALLPPSFLFDFSFFLFPFQFLVFHHFFPPNFSFLIFNF